MSTVSAEPGYYDLRALAAYSCCSIRWLRDRLVDHNHPLPHHRVEGKLLIRREDFDQWIAHYRRDRPANLLNEVVKGVIEQVAS